MSSVVPSSALTAIEKAKLRLLEIKHQAAVKKVEQERKLMAATRIEVPALSSLGWMIDKSVPWMLS